VVGILVDDAIVEIENIMRHLRMGKTPYQAAMEAADEIGLAVIATTFTLIAVFLPTAFMSGVPGKFFVQFGWTAAMAVFFSLVVARMLTPMMAAYLLKPPKPTSATTSRLDARLPGLVAWCLKHRVLTLLATVCSWRRLLHAGAAAARPGFIPPDDLRRPRSASTLPPGSTFARRWPRPSRREALVQPTRTSSWSTPRWVAGHGGQRPVCRRWRVRGAQGHADHQPHARSDRPGCHASRPSRPSCARP
jgi:multidrug efflux pump subunit AcrB